MKWVFQGGQQEAVVLSRVDVTSLTPDEKKAYNILKDQHKIARLSLDKKAKAFADKQVPLKSTVTDEEAEKWDRAYLRARSEQISNASYNDDAVDGVVAKCPHNQKVSDLVDFWMTPEPCNEAFWKHLITKMSKSRVVVGKSAGTFQFYYLRDGMQGLTSPTPFLKKMKIDASRNQDNLSWDENHQQLHSDVDDALVIFDNNGNLVDVLRLSIPIIVDINKTVVVGNNRINAYNIIGLRYVGAGPAAWLVNGWDGEKVIIYLNANFGYYGLAVQDKYRREGKVFVDIHGPGYTYGCIEVVESLDRDSAGNCFGLAETVTAGDENLPNYKRYLSSDSTGNPILLDMGKSRMLGIIQVIPPK
jgi:hypothetical protein